MSDRPSPDRRPGATVDGNPAESRPPRPLIERIGLALVAAFLGALFAAVAVAAWTGGDVFLAVMGGVGCLMTLWVGGLTLIRD